MIRIVGTALYQWDTGRYVTTDIEADHIHFSNKGDSKAVIVDLVDSQATIPDYLLKTGKQLCVYVVRNRVTVESRVFSVTPRERPADYIYEEDQRNFVYELIADAQEATKAANQAAKEATDVSNAIKEDAASGKFKGEKGEKGEPGEQGPKGEKGDPGTALIDNSVVGDSAWSSKNTVDKLCPDFGERGSVVVCEPVEGYPLRVSTYLPTSTGVSKITLYHEGIDEEDSREYTADFGGTYSDGYYDWETGELHTADEGTMQFAPQVITAFYGRNSFRSDCGDTFVGGMADPNAYWGKKLAEQEAINEELTAEVEALQAEQNKQYELIEDVTLDEDIANFIRTADPSGNKYNFSAIRIFIRTAVCATTAQVIFAIGAGSSTSYVYHQQNDILTKDTECDALFVERNDNGFVEYFCASYPKNQSAIMRLRPAYNIKVWQNVTRVSISANSSTATIPAGTNIKIYGIRG